MSSLKLGDTETGGRDPGLILTESGTAGEDTQSRTGLGEGAVVTAMLGLNTASSMCEAADLLHNLFKESIRSSLLVQNTGMHTDTTTAEHCVHLSLQNGSEFPTGGGATSGFMSVGSCKSKTASNTG
jgi:hypothetical protein